MKNFLKIFGIIAFVAVIELGLFTGCKEPESESSLEIVKGAQTVITISGLESYNGKYASEGIADTDNKFFGLALPTLISNGSVNLEMLDEEGKKVVSLKGTGHIVLLIYETNKIEGATLYEGATYPKSIASGNNAFTLGDFVE